MAFLHRRCSRPHLTDTTPPQIASTPSRSAFSTSLDKARSSSLIKRVSTIFSPRKKGNIPFEPLSNIAVDSRRRGSRSSSRTLSTTSTDDIRPPSGLGISVTRANSITSNLSLPSPVIQRFTSFERSRCISFPSKIYHNNTAAKELPPIPRQTVPSISDVLDVHRRTINIPPEVLDVILSFLHRRVVASLATVSENFSSAVRRNLYETLDLRTVQPTHAEQLSTLLASRWDLAEMVHTLICDTWPPSPPPPAITHFAFLAFPAPTFSVALRNMHHLTTLTLPSFDNTILRDRTGFRLKNLTFLDTTMSYTQQMGLFAWLAGQPEIISLSFPNLLEQATIATPTNVHNPNLPYNPAFSLPEFSSHSQPPSPVDPFTLVPALTALHAPPTLTTILAPARPLKDVTIHIRTNLDTGLRPSALMAAIRGIAALGIRFGANVDKRSAEKVLRAAAAVLGVACHLLDVEVGWLVSDESLYKMITHVVLPRFGVLHTLRLRRLPERSPPRSANGTTTTHPREEEKAYLELWLQHCPDLRWVEFLSGAEWHDGIP